MDSRKLFKKKKTKCFRDFTETINLKRKSKYIWNKTRIFKNKWVKLNLTNTKKNLQKK